MGNEIRKGSFHLWVTSSNPIQIGSNYKSLPFEGSLIFLKWSWWTHEQFKKRRKKQPKTRLPVKHVLHSQYSAHQGWAKLYRLSGSHNGQVVNAVIWLTEAHCVRDMHLSLWPSAWTVSRPWIKDFALCHSCEEPTLLTYCYSPELVLSRP